MQRFKSVPDRSIGDVGDIVRVGPRTYLKAGNGVWGLIVDKALIAVAKKLYCEQGLNLRETAEALKLANHPNISHSMIQRLANQYGWMRSHYGRRDANLEYLKKNKKKIIALYDDHACTSRDLYYLTSIDRNVIDSFLFKDLGLEKDRALRIARGKSFHGLSRTTWNNILTTSADDCTYEEYKKFIRRLTDVVYRRFFYDDHVERSMQRHVDHILSLRDGYWTFKNGMRVKKKRVVPFALMAHPENMRLVSSKINLVKGDASNHTLEELQRKVNKSKIQLVPIDRKKELRELARHYKLELYEEG